MIFCDIRSKCGKIYWQSGLKMLRFVHKLIESMPFLLIRNDFMAVRGAF